jgi:hypothetical protein
MFLRERATQAEYCDRPDIPDADLAANYHHLGRFNRLMLGVVPSERGDSGMPSTRRDWH